MSLPATRVAVLGGLDPLFVAAGRAAVAGVLALLALRLGGQGWPPWRMLRPLLLGEPLTPLLFLGLLCVGVGLRLVNRA